MTGQRVRSFDLCLNRGALFRKRPVLKYLLSSLGVAVMLVLLAGPVSSGHNLLAYFHCFISIFMLKTAWAP